ncbi:MAG: PAS domain-containing protein [Desulfobacterales bacterium]|nr:MAG: PAS domain-containing protein [Desulfobacterales bacterium]
MPYHVEGDFDPKGFALILEAIPVGITVVDLNGHIQYYNDFSSRILDRKPEYIGRDIRDCHEKSASIEKIDHMLAEFKKGRQKEFGYETIRNGKHLAVTFSPLRVDDIISFCIQTVILKSPEKAQNPDLAD